MRLSFICVPLDYHFATLRTLTSLRCANIEPFFASQRIHACRGSNFTHHHSFIEQHSNCMEPACAVAKAHPHFDAIDAFIEPRA